MIHSYSMMVFVQFNENPNSTSIQLKYLSNQKI
nr:MAG TPA: hypothetical protein [Caudoviricetes sp.]